MIRNKLVDLAVLVAFALGVADEDDNLHGSVNGGPAMYVHYNAREVCPWWLLVLGDRVISFSMESCRVFVNGTHVWRQQRRAWSATAPNQPRQSDIINLAHCFF